MYPVRLLLLAISVLSFATAAVKIGAVHAQGGFGDVTVTPTRIVLEGRDRSGTISLANTGSKKTTYRLSVVNMRMSETGGFQEIEEGDRRPGEKFADGLFRYAPRQVTLEPGETQIVRIATRKPAGLADGEYRSHLVIRAIPDADAGLSIENKTQNGLSVSVAVIPGIALPVILRHGQVSATANISDIDYEPAALTSGGDSAGLAFRLNRDGNASVYGDLSVTYFAPGEDEGILVSQVNQLAVYTPNAYRTVTMPLTFPENVEPQSGGRFAVTYREPPKEGGQTIAAGEYRIP
jgi:hypothetical protein